MIVHSDRIIILMLEITAVQGQIKVAYLLTYFGYLLTLGCLAAYIVGNNCPQINYLICVGKLVGKLILIDWVTTLVRHNSAVTAQGI